MRLIVFLAVCIVAVAAFPKYGLDYVPERIVGGSVTTISNYPSIATVLFSSNGVTYGTFCGSSILNNRSFLTAAHCTIGRSASNFRVRVGSTNASSGGVVYNTASLINHPDYNSWSYDNDISIIRSASTIAHNNNVRPASIPSAAYILDDDQVVWAAGWGATWRICSASNFRVRVGSTNASSGGVVYNTARLINHPDYNSWSYDNDISIIRSASTISHNNNVHPASIPSAAYILDDDQVVWATGWGATWSGGPPSEQLRHVQIWTINQNFCAQRYRVIGMTITDNMLCSGWLHVGGRDQCQGDSGGPLYHNGVTVGVCSFGQGCGLALFPRVNTRVSQYTAWIQKNA